MSAIPLRAYIGITRPVNVIMTMLSVVVMIYISVHRIDDAWLIPAFLAAVSAGLICAGANVINDYYDVDIDRINRPGRPLVTGIINKKQALAYWALLSLIGVFLNAFIHIVCLSIAAGTVGILWIYSRWLKQTTLWGNLTVSAVTGLTFLYAGAAVGIWQPVVLPALFAFLIHLAREILKDIEDVPGDRAQNARTFPIVYGERASKLLVTASLMILILATILAWIMDFYGQLFIYILAGSVYPALGYVMWAVWNTQATKPWRRSGNVLKLCMALGLAAIYFG